MLEEQRQRIPQLRARLNRRNPRLRASTNKRHRRWFLRTQFQAAGENDPRSRRAVFRLVLYFLRQCPRLKMFCPSLRRRQSLHTRNRDSQPGLKITVSRLAGLLILSSVNPAGLVSSAPSGGSRLLPVSPNERPCLSEANGGIQDFDDLVDTVESRCPSHITVREQDTDGKWSERSTL
jgi:hypothetical protein